MLRKTTFTLITILIAMLSMNFYCVEKDPVYLPIENTFQVPVAISPLKKSYSPTDTIWLTIDVPDKFLFDTKSNKDILVDTGEMVFGASFNEFGTYIISPSNGFAMLLHQAARMLIENYINGERVVQMKHSVVINQALNIPLVSNQTKKEHII